MTSYALIINNNYPNLSSIKLEGCYNDGDNIIATLKKIDPNTKIILMRDNLQTNSSFYPTKNNILRELRNLVNSSSSKLYFYYSGHGTYNNDYNNDENSLNKTSNGKKISSIQSLLKDSCIVTNEKTKIGLITDDELNQILLGLKTTQTLYGFMDSCYSGTGMDLCWINIADFKKSFTSKTLDILLNEINNCSLISGNYPDKVNKIKGNVILISGTRDNSYSYEGYSNGKASGLFTDKLCWLLNQNINNMSLKKFYLCLVGLINFKSQIPVLTTSMNINLDTTNMNNLNFKGMKTNSVITKNILLPGYKNLVEELKMNSDKLLYFYLLKSQQKN